MKHTNASRRRLEKNAQAIAARDAAWAEHDRKRDRAELLAHERSGWSIAVEDHIMANRSGTLPRCYCSACSWREIHVARILAQEEN